MSKFLVEGKWDDDASLLSPSLKFFCFACTYSDCDFNVKVDDK